MLNPPLLLATYINPLLVLFLLIAPLINSGPDTPRKPGCWEFWGRCLLGLGLAVALAESGKYFQVWSGHPSFPSGHETFGLCAATCLIYRDRRWLVVVLPLTALLAWALVAAHFHRPIDVAGAWLVGPPCAVLFQRIRYPRPV